MKISEATINILKNFSTINGSILFRAGSTIRIVSPQKTIIAKADVEEKFEKDFAIFDLPRFLGVLSLFDNPEIIIGDKEATIVDGKKKLVYVYADPTTFLTPPENDVKFPEASIQFELKSEDFQKVQRAANVLQLPEIAVIGDGTTISLKATDSKNKTSDSFKVEVGTTDQTFNAIFKNDNLKLIQNDYSVSISSKGISQWKTPKTAFWIVIEATSSFN